MIDDLNVLNMSSALCKAARESDRQELDSLFTFQR